LKITEVVQIFGFFYHRNKLGKKDWASVWGIFSQNRLVTLIRELDGSLLAPVCGRFLRDQLDVQESSLARSVHVAYSETGSRFLSSI
jgi:hypothetical protein